jgi:hypothetical protein
MKFVKEYYCCSEKLLNNFSEIQEIFECLDNVKWSDNFSFVFENKIYYNQYGYNKAFEIEFINKNWIKQPVLFKDLKLKGDYRKNDILIEIQFGNSATIYRDYYKFHYGLLNNLLSIAILIVPYNAKEFFPTRIKSVSNMAEFSFSKRTFNNLKIPIPILLIGLLPSN